MDICAEWIHCFHYEFEAAPYIEKQKWYAYAFGKGEYYDKQDRERRSKAKAAEVAAKGRVKVRR